ncbi:MAG: protein-glutamate O-methyltransferase [Deltaproteobacteria bacterium]|nr:protein-glutamate O-methyltransferase [Deltaproteobacteria bacterium]
MDEKVFGLLSGFIHRELGIKMPPAKRALLESRLQKRLRALGMKGFSEYCDFVFSPAGLEQELVHMIDLVTTNKTDFFREPYHFDFLTRTAVPDLIRTCEAGIKKPLSVWSAGCSTGEEPYTIAMVLNEYSGSCPELDFDYRITGTDISTRVLSMAGKGIYKEDRITPVPLDLKKKYVLKSKDSSKGLVRIVPELRTRLKLKRLNFMEEDFGFPEKQDIIFCRNVIIYFDKATQATLFNKFAGCMHPGSYMFIGHSETLSGFDLPFSKVAPSIYRKK